MALDDYKITTSDYTSKDISSLADRPALTASQLKARFDSLVKNVVAVKFNGLIDALVTAIAGLMSKVTGGTAGNFASLSSDGSIADSGKKAADFVLATNVIDLAHGGTGEETASAAIGALSESVACTNTGSATNKYTKIATVTCALYDHASGILQIQDAGSEKHYGLLQFCFTGAGTSVDVNRLMWISSSGYEAYAISIDATHVAIYIKIPHSYSISVVSFIGAHNGSVVLHGAQTLSDSLPDTPVATSVGSRMEYSTTITLTATHYTYDVAVSWATTDMWFEAISMDYPALFPARSYCIENGTVRIGLNKIPGTTYDGYSLNVKICGWK